MFNNRQAGPVSAGGARRQSPPQGQDEGAEDRGRRAGGEDRDRAVWAKSVEVYDPWHSSLEVGVKAETFRTTLTLVLSPVEAGKEGEAYEVQRGEARYRRDRKDQMLAFLKLEEVLVLSAYLDSFLDGRIFGAAVALGRDGATQVLLERCECYYGEDSPWYEDLRGSAVVVIKKQDDAGERTGIFFSRPHQIVLEDGAEPYTIFPEMMAIQACLRSFAAGIMRVDHAAAQLLDGARGGPAGPERRTTATAPERRASAPPIGGFGRVSGPGQPAGPGRPAGPQPARPGGAPISSARPAAAAGRQEGPVSDEEISEALGGAPPGGGLGEALSDETPSF